MSSRLSSVAAHVWGGPSGTRRRAPELRRGRHRRGDPRAAQLDLPPAPPGGGGARTHPRPGRARPRVRGQRRRQARAAADARPGPPGARRAGPRPAAGGPRGAVQRRPPRRRHHGADHLRYRRRAPAPGRGRRRRRVRHRPGLDRSGSGQHRQIGERIHLAEKTVKNYVSTILAKLQVGRRAEAAAYVADRRARQDRDA